MDIPRTVFSDPQSAARAVYQHVQAGRTWAGRFTLRPYNHYSPEKGPWWLVPGTEWPAYPYGKLFVQHYRPDPERMYAGFYVEHGYSAEDRGHVKDTELLTRAWHWHRVVKYLRGPEFAASIHTVAQRTGCPVLVSIEAWSSGHDPMTKVPDGRCEWAAGQGGALTGSGKPQGVLTELGKCASLAELSDQFQKNAALSWFWLDLKIGVCLGFGQGSEPGWGAYELWTHALEPWADWVE